MESGGSFALEDNWFELRAGSHQSVLFLYVLLGLFVVVEFQRGNSNILLGGVAEVACIVDDHPIFIVYNSSANKVVVGFWIFDLKYNM